MPALVKLPFVGFATFAIQTEQNTKPLAWQYK